MVGSGPMCWGREEVTGCSCGKRTCYNTATQTNEMIEVVPGLGDVLEENGLLGALLEGRDGGLVLTIWKRPGDEKQLHMGKAQSVLRKAPRPACMSPALEGGSGLCLAPWLRREEALLGRSGVRDCLGSRHQASLWLLTSF